MRREGRVTGLTPTGTEITRSPAWPAWISVSSVYVWRENTLTEMAASRESARKPLVASSTCAPDNRFATDVPVRCSHFFSGENEAIAAIGRAPTTRSAVPLMIGSMSLARSSARYWLSPSVLTMMSAPRASAAAIPVR